MKRLKRSSRGVVLFVVLAVLVIAILIAATVQSRADASIASTINARRSVQSRSAAWSGVQIVMAALAAQREDLLGGGTPRIEAELLAWQIGGTRVVARLVPLGGGGELLGPEAAKLNINACNAELLGAAGMPGAEAVSARASQTPFGSIWEAGSLSGTPVGEPGGEAIPADASATGSQSPSPVDLGTLFTAHSFDPNLRAEGEGQTAAAGLKRLSLAAGWTDDARSALAAVLGGDDAVAASIAGAQPKVSSRSEFVGLLSKFNVPSARWGRVLDSFSVTPDEFEIGLVDLSTASEEVLRVIPGIGAERAAQIVQSRGRLDASGRRLVTWPLEEGLLTPDEFKLAVDRLTTRCLQYRIVVAAGYEAGGAAQEPPPEGKRADANTAASDFAGLTLRQPMMLEAVVDVSSERPRVAYLRDVTYLAAARAAKGVPGVERVNAASEDPKMANENLTKAPGLQDSGTESGNNDVIETSEPLSTGDDVPSVSLPAKSRDRRIGRWTSTPR